MKFFHTSLRSTSLKAVLLGCVAAAPVAMSVGAHAGINDPLQVLYAFSGVSDNGGLGNAGVATSIHCTNVGGAAEKLQFVALDVFANPKANMSINLNSGETRTASTHFTALYSESVNLTTGTLNQGVVVVLGTSTAFTCTGQVLDASAAVPNGFNLHPMRFNPHPGTIE
jgi:hypothetical protein